MYCISVHMVIGVNGGVCQSGQYIPLYVLTIIHSYTSCILPLIVHKHFKIL